MFDISDEKYEELRQILEKQNERAYTFEEAKEMGDELIHFFTLLLSLDAKSKRLNEEQERLRRNGLYPSVN